MPSSSSSEVAGGYKHHTVLHVHTGRGHGLCAPACGVLGGGGQALDFISQSFCVGRDGLREEQHCFCLCNVHAWPCVFLQGA